MQIDTFPGCCTARVLVDFGQEHHSEFGARDPGDVTQRKMNQLMSYEKRCGIALVTAILTERQTKGLKLLLDNGFVQMTGWVEKEAHKDSKVALFVLDLSKWEEKKVEPVEEGVWIRNRGAVNPPKRAAGKKVNVRFRNGVVSSNSVYADGYVWEIHGSDYDIMAYKIVGDA